MLTDAAAVRTYFTKLGLEKEIADIYLALHAHGPQTISELSRNARVERTRIYRLIDKLLESNLIEVASHRNRGIIKAAPIANLHILISKKEQELKSLQDELSLIEQVLARNSLSSPAARVQFYEGSEGIRQMFWNQTETKTEIVSTIYKNARDEIDAKFFERWVSKCNERQIHFRSVYGDQLIQTRHYYGPIKHWQDRYIASDMFPINHSTTIYDNVVSYFNWEDGKIFGIEIYNKDIADTQRSLFEMLWRQSRPRANA